ncbi:hypothetical protein DEM27_20130 [Metarhizobium album]|uniref:Uncharacterized protein n=1 Tax=Metarhizobium album TaxID=2182425 RepID=A0A2U2DMB4_9HYPH|nr:hypothetical protein DEM27_20130 [Rhizobium album]
MIALSTELYEHLLSQLSVQSRGGVEYSVGAGDRFVNETDDCLSGTEAEVPMNISKGFPYGDKGRCNQSPVQILIVPSASVFANKLNKMRMIRLPQANR